MPLRREMFFFDSVCGKLFQRVVGSSEGPLGGVAFTSYPLLGGAAWPPDPSGGVAFAPLLLGVAGFSSFLFGHFFGNQKKKEKKWERTPQVALSKGSEISEKTL